MSVKAMSWALESAPVKDPTEALLLVALADRANDDGTGAYPSQDWLASRCRVTDRSVRRILASLEERKIISRGDQRMVLHYPSDRRPVVWNLNLSLDRSQASGGTPTSGRTPMTERPDAHDRNGRTPTSAKPSLEPSLNHPSPADAGPDSFSEFWSLYPKRVAKPAAVKAWIKALKDTPAEVILTGVKRFPFSPDLAFVPHPATWLNQRRWEDDTSPSAAKAPKLKPWEM